MGDMDSGSKDSHAQPKGHFTGVLALLILQGSSILLLPWGLPLLFPGLSAVTVMAVTAVVYLLTLVMILAVYSAWLRRTVGGLIYRFHRIMKEWSPRLEARRQLPQPWGRWGLGSYLDALVKMLPEMEEMLNRRRKVLEKNWYIREVVVHLNNLIFSLEQKDDLFHEILAKALETIPNADHGSMMVLREDGWLDFTAAVGFDLEGLKELRLRLKDTYLYRLSAGRCHRPVIVRNKQVFDAEAQNRQVLETLDELGSYDYSSTLTAPIIVGRELYGILNVDSDGVDAFNDEDVVMMEYFTNQMGLAIRNHNLMERALQQSRFDGLTKICNRQYFEELIGLVMEQSRRNGQGFQLVIFDLNDFKPVNDRYGHGTGDQLIQVFSEALEENKRDSDFVGRLGGDEFIAAYLYCSPDDVDRMMEKLRTDLDRRPVTGYEPHAADPAVDLTVSFSYGKAGFPGEGTELQDLITLADRRMYQNKQFLKGQGAQE